MFTKHLSLYPLKSRLAVRTRSPANEVALLSRVSRQAVSGRPPHVVNKIVIRAEDLIHEELPTRTGGSRVERDLSTCGDAVVLAPRPQPAICQIEDSVGDGQQPGVAVPAVAGIGDRLLGLSKGKRGVNAQPVLALDRPSGFGLTVLQVVNVRRVLVADSGRLFGHPHDLVEIGRASCRERVGVGEGAAALVMTAG